MKSLDLAEQLTQGVTAPLERAGLSLLIGLFGLWDRVDVVPRWYAWPAQGAPEYAVVRWDRVADDADRGAVPMSPGERAVLLIAASLADGYRVDLASCLPAIDSTHMAALTMALYTLKSAGFDDTARLRHLALIGQADR